MINSNRLLNNLAKEILRLIVDTYKKNQLNFRTRPFRRSMNSNQYKTTVIQLIKKVKSIKIMQRLFVQN